MARTVSAPVITDYVSADTHLGSRDRVKIAHNTYLVRRDRFDHSMIAVQLHGTDIVTYVRETPDVVTLDAGGWATVTTANRMHQFTPPAVRVNVRPSRLVLIVTGADGDLVEWDGRGTFVVSV